MTQVEDSREKTAAARPRWVPVLLVGLPLWLVVSAGFGLWFYFKHEKEQAEREQARFAQSVNAPTMADDLRKFIEVIGERNSSSEEAATALGRAASMIEGLLGPSNTGYTVTRERGPGDWPLLHVTLPGRDAKAPAVWVVTSYDSRPGSPGAEANASGVTAVLAAASHMAQDKPASPVHFVFLPHVNDPDSPVLETASLLYERIRRLPVKAVLCVEAMGLGETLWLTSRDTDAAPLGHVDGLGAVIGAEVVCLADDTDLASILFEMDLPAVRVATGPVVPADAPDARPAFPATLAASTGRLIELIRRCAR